MPYILDRRIDLLQPAGAQVSETGAETQKYRIKKTAAALMSDRGRKEIEDSLEIPASQKRYVIRYRKDITTAWKAMVRDISYDVDDVSEIPGERRKSYLMVTLERSNKTYSITRTPLVN